MVFEPSQHWARKAECKYCASRFCTRQSIKAWMGDNRPRHSDWSRRHVRRAALEAFKHQLERRGVNAAGPFRRHILRGRLFRCCSHAETTMQIALVSKGCDNLFNAQLRSINMHSAPQAP